MIKFYEPMSDAEGQKVIRDCFVPFRNVPTRVQFSGRADVPYWKDKHGEDVKLVYRHYATLYFIFVVDSSEVS